MRSTIDHAGRVLIPKAVRESAGLRPGAPLEIAYRDGKVEIEALRRPVKLVRKSGLLIAVPPRGTAKVTGTGAPNNPRPSRKAAGPVNVKFVIPVHALLESFLRVAPPALEIRQP